MWRVMTRMVEGRAEKREIDMLLDVTKQIEGHTICALGDAAAWPIQGLITHFRPVIEKRIDDYTYLHAVAETVDSRLYMAARFIKAAGGCSAPARRLHACHAARSRPKRGGHSGSCRGRTDRGKRGTGRCSAQKSRKGS